MNCTFNSAMLKVWQSLRKKLKFLLEIEMYQLRRTYFRANPSQANIAGKSRK